MTALVRGAAIVAGVVATAYGVWLLVGLGWADVGGTAEWLVGGVVLHDAVFAPVVIAAGVLAVRWVRRDLLVPWVVAAVILVPVTVAAIPELGRFGARPDNPTLLDRPYWLGWGALVTLVVVAALLGRALTSRWRTRGGGGRGQGAGGR